MKLQTTNTFKNNFIENTGYKIFVNRGGTRSGKTYNICIGFAYWLMFGYLGNEFMPSGTIQIVRKWKDGLRGTVQRDFEDILTTYERMDYVDRNKQNKTYVVGNRMVEFIGADDPQKLKGGKRDILYANEANELIYDQQFFQLLIRTKYKVFIDFNPDDEDNWINTELEQKRYHNEGDVKVVVSTYKDNPFLETEEVREIENIKNIDYELWKIYGLGEYGKMEGVVFENWKIVKEIPENAERLGLGLDFGYTNDQTALIDVYYYDGELYIDEILYETGLLNNDIANKIHDFEIRDTIYADSSEPKSIEEIKQNNIDIRSVQKGPDSVVYGINLLKQYNINVTSRSANLQKELRKYIWDKDKDGKKKNQPIDAYNHAIDAMRYAVMMTIKKPTNILDSIFIG